MLKAETKCRVKECGYCFDGRCFNLDNYMDCNLKDNSLPNGMKESDYLD